MKEGLLEKIQSNCFWRINIRPVLASDDVLSLQSCLNMVDASQVSLRGWNYPHVSNKNDENGGVLRSDKFVEGWIDWWKYTEFWRMYRSSQFLHYLSLRENRIDDDVPRKPNGPAVSVLGSIYTLTEIVEFLFRLHKAGLYTKGALLDVSLKNCEGRRLWVSESNRMDFWDMKETSAQQIQLKVQKISEGDFSKTPIEYSLVMALEFFDHFGWNPNADLIRNDQLRFYNGIF